MRIFDTMPFQFQQGVYLEFFRERGIEIVIKDCYKLGGSKYYETKITVNEMGIQTGQIIGGNNDYNTAFTHAIQKACELYGKDLK